MGSPSIRLGFAVARTRPAIAALLALLALSLVSTQTPNLTADEGTSVAATLPAGFTETTVATGLSNPTAMAFAPDGRLFVAQQGGALRVIKNGALLSSPFITLSVDSSGERGLLGIAFDPLFTANNYIYLYYTVPGSPARNRLSRFTANGDVVVSGSEFVVLNLDSLSSATNHNGGAIHFGPDGKLYVAVGENATASNAQTLTNLHGKMLRLNKDGTIPADNPFYGSTSGNSRAIWAYGLRNPFTFNFQPGTGRMFINDVGAGSWEEINDGLAGSNYGWPTTEGPTTNPSFRSPLHAYPHSGGSANGCAITGGAFYNPATVQFPSSYVGKYFFADYCSGWIRHFDPSTGGASGFATGIGSPVDLQVHPDGSLYYLYRSGGGVRRITYNASQAPSITQHPASITVSTGAPASFSCAASGTSPLSYQWQRNGSNISGATSQTYVIASASMTDNGAQFRCVVTNIAGSATSNNATLTVTTNTAPTASISAPAAGTTYAAGTTINYSGTGTDSQDGPLPASAFTWQVDFHHDSHTHPFVPATIGSMTGSFVIPAVGETATNVWYRIYLTVTDSGGMTHTAQRDITPRTSQITIASVRSGLQITVDGQPYTTPHTFSSVHGMQRSIGTSSPQTVTSAPWTFQSWSDNGAMTHNITTPITNATYTATFRAQMSVPANEPIVPIGGSQGGIVEPIPDGIGANALPAASTVNRRPSSSDSAGVGAGDGPYLVTSADVRVPLLERVRTVLRASMLRERWNELPGWVLERVLSLAFSG